MKTSDEIEKLAKDSIFTEEGQVGFVVGYNRCSLDNIDKKFTEEDIKKAILYGHDKSTGGEYLSRVLRDSGEFINTLIKNK